MGVTITRVRRADDDVLDAINRLLPQLSRTTEPLDTATLAGIVEQDSTWLLVARDDDRTGADAIVGMLTLVVLTTPVGRRARIEDVVVDDAARGSGVGRVLTEEAVRIAGVVGARHVDLTSRPAREAANRLYVRLGFAPQDSNLYRITPRPRG